ncbi:MAG: SDR family oxidoreductase [Gammaproteobacteria bacterium]|nr:SDR family oxidoreductase [Gammaproteobacteria bacterium]
MSTVLLTGASRGIGAEFVRQYAADGWRVHALARDPGNARGLAEVCRVSGDRVRVHAVDVTDHAAIDALATDLAGTPIDVLLNVAGVLVANPFGQSDYERWMNSIRVNVFGPMKVSEAFVDHVTASEQRKIVTLTSVLGSIGGNEAGGMYDYRSTKAAVNAVMKSMSVDLAGRRIIAVPIHPGWVRTDMGGSRAEVDVATSVTGLRAVIAGLTIAQSGRFLTFQGAELPW